MQGSKHAKLLRRRQTDVERMLWYQLRNRRFCNYKFRRQMPIGPYVTDFVCMSARLIIELDGGQHATATSKDESRTDFLRREGYEVIRFWNNEVLQNLDGVLSVILETLKKRETPSP